MMDTQTTTRRAGRIQPTHDREHKVQRPGVRVLCVDDHTLLVEGLRAQFNTDGRLAVVGHLTSADGLLDAVDGARPDVVLLDIEMPGMDVFEAADRLRHAHPGMRFVFLSAHVRESLLSAAYRSGAWGYFSKGDDLDDIVDGLMEIARSTSGTFVMGPKVRSLCVSAIGDSSPSVSGSTGAPLSPLDGLTDREVEVLRLIGKGLSRSQIAGELCRSAKTVDGHQERMMRKLGIDSRAELMRFAIREGLAEA